MGLNVHIYIFDDLETLPQAVASVREVLGDVDIHVLDGRYELFDGETDLTPGLRGWCAGRANVHYHAPPESWLPFGHDVPNPPEHRPGNYAKAVWTFDEVLPPNEWTLKLDADEQLRRFDVDLDELTETTRYAPVIDRVGTDDRVHVARLFQPRHWTPWINDCLLPRALFPRQTTPLSVRQRLWRVDEFRAYRTVRLGFADKIEIANYDAERDVDWQARRTAHLDAIGRTDHHLTGG